MKKNMKLYLILTIMVGSLMIFGGIEKIVFADPGAKDDPLVTFSYVQNRIEQIKFYINEKINEVTNIANDNKESISNLQAETKKLSNSKGGSTSVLEVVELKNGQRLICEAGTEIILRGGKAQAIASEQGGLSDVTGAIDIKMNGNIPPNHLIIVPRNDGRGVYVKDYAIFMVRGGYEIK